LNKDVLKIKWVRSHAVMISGAQSRETEWRRNANAFFTTFRN